MESKYSKVLLSLMILNAPLSAEISTNNISISNGDTLSADSLNLINQNQILNITGANSKITLSNALNIGNIESTNNTIIESSNINITNAGSLESNKLNAQGLNNINFTISGKDSKMQIDSSFKIGESIESKRVENFALNLLDSAVATLNHINIDNAKNIMIKVDKAALTFSDSAFIFNKDSMLESLSLQATNKANAITFTKGDLNLDSINNATIMLGGTANTLKFNEANKGLKLDSSTLNLSINNTQNLNIESKNSTINITSLNSNTGKLTGNLIASEKSNINANDSKITLESSITLNNSNLNAYNISLNANGKITLQDSSSANVVNLKLSKLSSWDNSQLVIDNSSNLNVKNLIFDSGTNIALNTNEFGNANFTPSNIILQNKAKLVASQDLNLKEGQTLTIGTQGIKAAIPGVIVSSSRDTSSLEIKNNTLNLANGVTLNVSGGQHSSTAGTATLYAKEVKLDGGTSHAYANMNIQYYGNAKVEQMTINNGTLKLVTYRTDPTRVDSNGVQAPIITTKLTQPAINTDMKIALTNNATLSIDRYTLESNATLASNITADSTSRMSFGMMDFTSQGSEAKFGVSTNIESSLTLTNVGKNSNFTMIDFTNAQGNSTFSLESNSKLKVTLDDSIFKGSTATIDTNKAYELIKTNFIQDNRSDKRIDFTWGANAKADITKQYFIVGKVQDSGITLTFLDESPYSQMAKGNFDYVDSKLTNIESNERKLAQIVQEDVINRGYIDGNTTSQNLEKMNNILDEALRSDDYSKFENYLSGIESNMQTLADSNTRSLGENILIANNQTMNNRVAYIRFAQNLDSKNNVILSQNCALSLRVNESERSNPKTIDCHDFLQKSRNDNAHLALNEQNIESKSDIDTPNPLKDSINTYRPIADSKGNPYADNAWGDISGGYFGGKNVANLGFVNINGGYDKILKHNILVGAMLGFGTAKGGYSNIADMTYIVNFGLYTHVPLNKHEIASNLNTSLFLISRDISGNLSDSAYSKNVATLWNLYYKYSLNLGNVKEFSQIVKPVLMLGFGAYNVGTMSGKNIYRMNGYNDFSLELGLGGEYVLSKDNAFYSVQFLILQPLFHSVKSVEMTLLNAQSTIIYDLPKELTSYEINLNGAHRFRKNMYVQYGITTLFSNSGTFGIKANARIGYQF
ncbi:hypothetical protein DCO58_04420 [Helicobacter saguini]|uniref:Autotransporter domain-containing protein n=1 Tax=Helicobacter saguini TaxID=1548018 RepID=A0A347VSQ9_9HELI|nr:hypothetical protein [Helicobacter saguini]MWV62401.1 hypothetical protein [Helicobacter saguini]MWV66927.1 hypothetical protein [Helicobacter saguini]MWV69275.1 hypothetical protein [Helicobacter saguini]MWV71169.1 hypothetical protein [Helicobacter saguini]TLD94943.1 hypothetical protein LS64_003195 [Helicobacter saguini]